MLPDLSIHARLLRGPRQHVRLSGRGGIDDGDQQPHTLLSHSGGHINIYIYVDIFFYVFRYFAPDPHIICQLSLFNMKV